MKCNIMNKMLLAEKLVSKLWLQLYKNVYRMTREVYILNDKNNNYLFGGGRRVIFH